MNILTLLTILTIAVLLLAVLFYAVRGGSIFRTEYKAPPEWQRRVLRPVKQSISGYAHSEDANRIFMQRDGAFHRFKSYRSQIVHSEKLINKDYHYSGDIGDMDLSHQDIAILCDKRSYAAFGGKVELYPTGQFTCLIHGD